jgi:mRNA interferase YafQ
MRKVSTTKAFEKALKIMEKRGRNLKKLTDVISKLVNSERLPHSLKSHKLKGNLIGRFECHIEPDWLLVYRIDGEKLILEQTGTHSDLF